MSKESLSQKIALGKSLTAEERAIAAALILSRSEPAQASVKKESSLEEVVTEGVAIMHSSMFGKDAKGIRDGVLSVVLMVNDWSWARGVEEGVRRTKEKT